MQSNTTNNRELLGEQSQSDMARKLGLSYQAYQRLEKPRKSDPTVKTLEKIACVRARIEDSAVNKVNDLTAINHEESIY